MVVVDDMLFVLFLFDDLNLKKGKVMINCKREMSRTEPRLTQNQV